MKTIWVIIESTCQYEQAETNIAFRESEEEAEALVAELNKELDDRYPKMEAWHEANPEPCDDTWRAWHNEATRMRVRLSKGIRLEIRLRTGREDHTLRIEKLGKDIARSGFFKELEEDYGDV